jgi:hypothetical protein
MFNQPVLSRHRLPAVYRISLTGLWLAPGLLLLIVLTLRHGGLALLDMRLLLPLALMTLPALYVWHEGVDVLPGGIVRRVHVPRYYTYQRLETWHFDDRSNRRTLTIWDAHSRKVIEVRASHLTDLPLLLHALKANVRPRHWPH